jgi:hypothetical protein
MKTFIFRDLMRSLVAAVILTMAMSTAFGQEYRSGTGKACKGTVRAKTTYTVPPTGTARPVVTDNYLRPNTNKGKVAFNRFSKLFKWNPNRRRTHRKYIVR